MPSRILSVLVVAAIGCAGESEPGPRAPDDADELGTPGPADAGAGSVDAGAAPSTCDPVRGTGCNAPLFVCKLIDGARCTRSPAIGQRRGDRCVPGECAVGLTCLRLVETSTDARCFAVCELETGFGCEGLPGDFECRLRIDEQRWGACLELPPRCNPYIQSRCEPSQACQPFLRRTGARELRCVEAGDRAEGETCGARIGVCARGLACVTTPDAPVGEARCRQYCELNADCPEPLQCIGRVDEPSFTFCLP